MASSNGGATRAMRAQSLSNARRSMGIGTMRGVTVSNGRVSRIRPLRG